MNINLKLFLTLISTQFLFSQQNAKPKLIVGIVIDQMRAEYLYRFEENYSENGFKRLMKEGFNVKNTHHNYVSTTTGPGHASIYTGTTPANHGIVANSWYDRKSKSILYCAEGSAVNNIKGNQKNEVSRSPENLLVSTITDELKLHSNHRSKVIGVSLKDRGAIFPAGHLADYAFWYDSDSGDFTTSTYYNNKLPDWLVKFNQRKLADSLLNLVWKPLLPIDKYVNSLSDNASNEKLYVGRKSAVFPYDLKKIRKDNGNFDLIYEVPFGNSLLTELVMQTIKGEDLGGDQETDFLCVSYSSTDKVGHSFGRLNKF